jgi:hypothetical protein
MADNEPIHRSQPFDWEQLQSEGRFDSVGEFTLDYQKSHSSLAKFFRPQDSDFLHFLLRFAISSSSEVVIINADPKKFRIDFGEANLTPEEMDRIWTSGQRNLRYLAMDLAGAWVQGVTQVYLETPACSVQFTSSSYLISQTSGGGASLDPNPDSLRKIPRGKRCRLSGTCSKSKDFDLGAFEHSFREIIHNVTRRRSLGSWLIKLFARPETRKRKLACTQDPKLTMVLSYPEHLEPKTDGDYAKSPGHDWEPIFKIPAAEVKAVVDGCALAMSEKVKLCLPPLTLFIELPHPNLDLSLCRLNEAMGEGESKALIECLFKYLLSYAQENYSLESKSESVPIGVLEWLVAKLWAEGDYFEAARLCRMGLAQFPGVHPILCAMQERITLEGRLNPRGVRNSRAPSNNDSEWGTLIKLGKGKGNWVQPCLFEMQDRGLLNFDGPNFVQIGLAKLSDHMRLALYRHQIRIACFPTVLDEGLVVDYLDSVDESLAASFLTASHLQKCLKFSLTHDRDRNQSKSFSLVSCSNQTLIEIYSAVSESVRMLLGYCDEDRIGIPLRPTDREEVWKLCIELCSVARSLASALDSLPKRVQNSLPELFVLEAVALARRGKLVRSETMLREALGWPSETHNQISGEAKAWLEQERWRWASS